MFSIPNRQPKPVYELNPANIYAGAVIGDCFVEMLLMHIDPRGAIHPIWAQRVPIDIPMSVTPSIKDITTALVQAWTAKREPDQIHYNRFFLCLPAWICNSTTDVRQITIPDETDFGIPRTFKVTRKDVRKLKTVISSEGTPEHHLIVDLIPHKYILDTKRLVMDPCGNISRNLGLESLVTYSEIGFTKAILDCLNELGIEVDVMMSPFEAHAGMLSPDEKKSGAVVVDVGRRCTACSFFKDGYLQYSTLLHAGSDNILTDIAEKLNLSFHEAEEIVSQQQELIHRSNPNHKIQSLPLFAWATSHPSTRRLDSVAALSMQKLFNEISRRINSTSIEMMIKFDAVVLAGDDQLTVRILRDIFQDMSGIRTRLATGSGSVPAQSSCADCHIRSTGFMEHARQFQSRFQFYLERYNESVADVFTRTLSKQAANLCAWSIKKAKAKIKEFRQKLPVPGSVPAITTQTPAERFRTIALPQARQSIPVS